MFNKKIKALYCQEFNALFMSSPKTEFPTQCWGGEPYFINLFLESQEKKRVVFYVFHLFFCQKKSKTKIR
jgi:hypothetical protein